MKTTLSFGLIVAAASTLLACSDEEGTPRNNAGTGQVAMAGSAGQGSGGSAGQGSGGTSQGGGAGGAGTDEQLGDALVITPLDNGDASVVDPTSASGVDGAVILAQSATMEVPAERAHREGALCMSGTTAVVPDDSSYGTHWGAELSMDLLLGPVDGAAAPVADAGADAGAPELERKPWPYGNVTGFSFKIVGQDPDAPRGGLPDALRFKGLPVGDSSDLVTYCNTVSVVEGGTQTIPFSDITFECWNAGNPSLADAEINTITEAGAGFTTRTNPRQLQTISWQVPADLLVPHQFDFCVTDLRPILATP